MKMKFAACLSALVAAAPQQGKDKDDYSEKDKDYYDDGFRTHNEEPAVECRPYCQTVSCTPSRPNTNQNLFIPYGSAAGDTEGERRDDTFEGPVVLSDPVPFFERSYQDVYFSSNGVISFERGVRSFTSRPFPLDGEIMFSPYWADFNTAVGGNWYYRILTASDMQVVNDIIGWELDMPDFEGVTGFVVTYKDVNFYGSQRTAYGPDRYNSVQAIVVHDNNYSFAIFNYGDVEWTTGTASGGDRCTGLGGTPAQIGFNDGYGNFYTVPGSQTNDIVEIETRTNVKSTGRFVFRVNGAEVVDPNPGAITEPQVNDLISSTQTQVGIEQFLEYKGFDYSRISSHGCFCKNLADSAYGYAVDGLDIICRNWVHARRCSKLLDGQCYEAANTDYTAGTNNCENAGTSDCDDAACGIDEYWFNELENYLAAYPNWFVERASCEKLAPNYFRDHCCGNEPASMAMYSPDHETCENGVLYPFIQEFQDAP